jgi:cytochrome o ubiquinol oxidase operon protein cyoD
MSQTPVDSAGMSRGTVTTYLTGFILALILTGIPFGFVMSGAFSTWAMIIAIFGAGVVQIVVHLHYFLHLDTSSAARWNVAALVFTIVILTLFVGGSLWIMWTLNYRMM